VRVLIDYRPALRERSGAGEYTHQLVRALLRATAQPLDLTLFSSSWKDRLVPDSDVTGAAIVDCRVPVRLLNLAWHRFGWPSAETLTGRPFDVTHSSHPLLFPARDAAQVITIHDLNFLSHPEFTRAEIRRDYPPLARGHAQRADAILTPSAFTAVEIARQFGVGRERIAVCPPGAPDWAPRAAAPRDGYILFFGTLEPRKNVGGLLDAYERLVAGPAEAGHYERDLPDLVLAGRAGVDARPWLDRIARPPLAGRVRHIGYVDPADRQALYAGARLLVMPSFDEGFGLPVLEAMTVGVPVVAASRGSLPEVLGDAGPLVDPAQPADIAAAIDRVLSDAAYASGCVARGLARAREFRWDRTAERVVDTYRQAIERRARRTAR
jgi:glycosyltransferase involved in cell wall biosynthesis